MWKEATPFDNQEGFNEKELFFITSMQAEGYEVRFNETHILHKKGDSITISILRTNLAMKKPDAEKK